MYFRNLSLSLSLSLHPAQAPDEDAEVVGTERSNVYLVPYFDARIPGFFFPVLLPTPSVAGLPFSFYFSLFRYFKLTFCMVFQAKFLTLKGFSCEVRLP
jgi:hypothetical protein